MQSLPPSATEIRTGEGCGRLFILSAPSGAGKSTLCHAILQAFPDLCYSISYTSRPPRPSERNGIDYHFINPDEFRDRIDGGQWAEWARVHDNYYGTDSRFLEQNLSSGRDILLDIDVQGAAKIVARYPGCITIFIQPPSLEVLRQRLLDRGADTLETIERRLCNAVLEMAAKTSYAHVIVNDVLASAIERLTAIIESYRNQRVPGRGNEDRQGGRDHGPGVTDPARCAVPDTENT